MSGLNRVQIIGRLGRDPEIRYAQNGTAVCNLNVAVSENWTDKQGQKQEKTEWIRCAAFGKQAEILEKYLSKGSQIYLEGKMQTRQYDKDGQTHYATEVLVREFVFLGGKSESGPSDNRKPAQHDTRNPQDDIDERLSQPSSDPDRDDLPF